MKRELLKVGDEVAIGRGRSHWMTRGMVADLRSWVRVYDKELGENVDVLRKDFKPGRHGTRYSQFAPQSGILVRIHERDDVWSEPRLVYVRDIRRFWAEEEERRALAREAEVTRREREKQMKLWLDWLEIPYDEGTWTYSLDRDIRVTYEEIGKLYERFNEARLGG